jgi:phage I-like protein
MCEQCPSCYKHNKALAERELHMGMRWRGDLLVDYDHRTKNEVHETLNNTYVKEEDLRCEQTS